LRASPGGDAADVANLEDDASAARASYTFGSEDGSRQECGEASSQGVIAPKQRRMAERVWPGAA